mgnify:CR=1 FL=1
MCDPKAKMFRGEKPSPSPSLTFTERVDCDENVQLRPVVSLCFRKLCRGVTCPVAPRITVTSHDPLDDGVTRLPIEHLCKVTSVAKSLSQGEVAMPACVNDLGWVRVMISGVVCQSIDMVFRLHRL